ncbi:MAG: hypothetical protein ACFFCW_47770 [Candidatus Hodarchaeota archaeon]
MSKVKVRVVSVGHLPADIDLEKIKSWKSEIFELSEGIENYGLRSDSDTNDWGYSDKNISSLLPDRGSEDFLVALVSVRLEDNYYARRVQDNKVVLTFYEISDYLRQTNIPIENVVLRLLYAYSLLYRRSGARIPENSEFTNFTHDETRGCIYDMNGLKEDIVFSCVKPIICSECSERIVKEKVSQTSIDKAKSELSKIDKQLFYQIADWVKFHPIIAILVSSVWAIVLGVIGSLIVKGLFEKD